MLVSVITPAYNTQEYISETIDSVISQTYNNWEMIIVDDCSTDETASIVEAYISQGVNINLIRLKEKHGPALTRNVALKAAKGRFIAFLDADDIWLPEKLEYQVNTMITHNYAFSFTSYEAFRMGTRQSVRIINVPLKLTYRTYLRNTIIGCLTVMIDKEKTGFFEMPDIRSSHDMALWLRILKDHPAYGIQKVLARYRILPVSNTSKKLRASRDVWRVYREYEKLSFLFSLFNFLGYIFYAIRKRI